MLGGNEPFSFTTLKFAYGWLRESNSLASDPELHIIVNIPNEYVA